MSLCGLAVKTVSGVFWTWANRIIFQLATGFCEIEKKIPFVLGEEPVVRLDLADKQGKRKASAGKNFL